MAGTDKRMQLHLTARQHAAVQRLARRSGISMTSVVRNALDAYLAAARTRHPLATDDPLADLIGVIDRPGDLARRHDDSAWGSPRIR